MCQNCERMIHVALTHKQAMVFSTVLDSLTINNAMPPETAAVMDSIYRAIQAGKFRSN